MKTNVIDVLEIQLLLKSRSQMIGKVVFTTQNWLVGCLTACQHRKLICANCGGIKSAQSTKDGQQDTMHATLRYTKTV